MLSCRFQLTHHGLADGAPSGQALDLFGGAKVGQLDEACVVHQDVCALDVTVHDPVTVQVLQALEDLPRVALDDGLIEFACRAQGAELLMTFVRSCRMYIHVRIG